MTRSSGRVYALVGAALIGSAIIPAVAAAQSPFAPPVTDTGVERPVDIDLSTMDVTTLRVVGVGIAGSDELDDDELKDGLAMHGPRCWLPVVDLIRCTYTAPEEIELDRDRARIERYYHKNGFFSAKVDDIAVRSVGDREVTVTFEVSEGEPSLLADVVVVGAPGDGRAEDAFGAAVSGRPRVDAESLRELAGLKPGSRFIYERYQEAELAIAQALSTAGFAHAQVRGAVAVDRVSHKVVVRFDIDAGPQVRFGEVAVEGLTQIPEETVRARVSWTPGEVFDPREVAATRSRLQGLRRFRTVRIEFSDREQSEVEDIKLSLIESPRREIKLGAGLGIDSESCEVRGRGSYQVNGFPDPLSVVEMNVRPAYSAERGDACSMGSGLSDFRDKSDFVGEASMGLRREDFYYPLLRADARVAYEVDNFDAYSSYGPEARLGLQRPFLSRNLFVGVSWQFKFLRFFDESDEEDEEDEEDEDPPPMHLGSDTRARLGLVNNYFLGTFEQHLVYDRRNDPLNTREGVYVALRLRQAGRYSGSEFSFLTVMSDVRGYLSFGERVTLAARLSHGRLLAGDELPITERFYSGGATSQRGFAQRQLAPSEPGSGVEYGGDALVEVSAEARVQLVKLAEQWLGLVLFSDGADVTDVVSELPLTDPLGLHWAVGAGLRYATPVGPLRVDFGYRVNRTGPDEPWYGNRYAFHVSIGEAF
ncbi:MAG: hypothetical protein Tsb0020_42400 [Haliangiales bacterium]